MSSDYSAPDGERESLFEVLSRTDRETAERLARRYALRWLDMIGHSRSRLPDVVAALEIKIAPDVHGTCLRIRSFVTGSTYWLHDWDGSPARAEAFADEVGELQAANFRDMVADDRREGIW